MLKFGALPSPPEPLHPARVTRAWSESETLRGLAFVCDEIDRRHERPGQFVRLQVGPAQKHFALASEPGAGEMELLFKADALPPLAPGDTIHASAPQGRGFPVDEHQGQSLILCAAGTGIAPLRAVVKTLLHHRERFGEIVLFYGQRTMAHFAYAGEHAAWRAAEIEVHLVASEGGGRLQQAVRSRRPSVTDACAYLCGMKAMVDDLAQILEEMGLPNDRVFLNS